LFQQGVERSWWSSTRKWCSPERSWFRTRSWPCRPW